MSSSYLFGFPPAAGKQAAGSWNVTATGWLNGMAPSSTPGSRPGAIMTKRYPRAKLDNGGNTWPVGILTARTADDFLRGETLSASEYPWKAWR
jgi:hypothetical protein